MQRRKRYENSEKHKQMCGSERGIVLFVCLAFFIAVLKLPRWVTTYYYSSNVEDVIHVAMINEPVNAATTITNKQTKLA